MNYGGTVDLDHFHQARSGNVLDVPKGPKAGVVDQQLDVDALAGGKSMNLRRGSQPCQVGGTDFDANAVLGGQHCAKVFEAVDAAGGEDQMRAADGEAFGQRQAYSGTGPSNNRPLPGPFVGGISVHG